ncbi:oligoribonuclease [Halobacillus andaensis]|uniref:Oligoribonuclease n=1 Tax=Halobacillus andaensis TaxID=1176239 RepID=A0A917AZR2_HALAA|nr:bifunctional oligoribonuclease/PAP phosphatase NrnA [Halobacillus andaensis]MBP2002854.1 phosphoesterase RecJ-like protein [Halobacillus andaensis]GGF06165.1 oligoribonuclease [Halobacillus andaensis]
MTLHKIMDAIKQHKTIIIHRHVRPDPDALGSQGGLAEFIRYNFPEKKVLITGENEPSLQFLTKMDEVSDKDYEGALVIVCDTANQPRIDDQRYAEGAMLIKIDHHPIVDEYGDISWVDTQASSASEMVYSLYKKMAEQGYSLNERAASLLYAGIVGDTGRFLFPSTTEKTFAAASELVSYNFDRPEMYNQLYRTPVKVAKLKGYVLENFTLYPQGYSTVRLPKDILDKYEVSPTETSAIVGLLGDIEGILAWVYFVEEEDSIRVRLRSKGPIVNKIAENHNGGGHPMAAGATASSWEETDVIAEELKEACASFARDNK